ncbi:MAG: hypothetical protein ABL866_15750 [Devosia sp.]
MQTAPVKFNFDLDLGRRQERNSIVSDTAMAAMLAKARAEGYEQGLADGGQSAAAKAAQRLTLAAESLAGHTATMTAALDDRTRQTLAEAVELAATIGRKLAAHLLVREPVGEIDALLTECLASLDGVPHLVIRCAPELADAIREVATVRVSASGFAGRLVVLGDPELAQGDGKIEWVDGGLVRDRALLEAEIDGRITAYLAAKGISRSSMANLAAGENEQ